MQATDSTPAPWLETPDLDAMQTGARIRPDARPLPAERVALRHAGAPPVHLRFGSMRAPKNVTQVAVDAIRARGRCARFSHGRITLRPIDEGDDRVVVGEVNQQALFGRVATVVPRGGADTTTDAARAGAPRTAVPRWRTSRTGPAAWPSWTSPPHTRVQPRRRALSAALPTTLTPETRVRVR